MQSDTEVTFLEVSGHGIAATAAGISQIEIGPTSGPSAFVRPQSVHFLQDGRKRRWDIVASHPSVAIIAYHRELNALLLVRQFRPAVYAAELAALTGQQQPAAAQSATDTTGGAPSLPLERGFTYELCAGIVDKPGKQLAEIAKEEIAEEMGYNVNVAAIVAVGSCLTAVGISGARQSFFYVEVDESMRVAPGGGNPLEGEAIDVVAVPVAQLERFATDPSLQRPAGAIFAAMWLKARLGV